MNPSRRSASSWSQTRAASLTAFRFSTTAKVRPVVRPWNRSPQMSMGRIRVLRRSHDRSPRSAFPHSHLGEPSQRRSLLPMCSPRHSISGGINKSIIEAVISDVRRGIDQRREGADGAAQRARGPIGGLVVGTRHRSGPPSRCRLTAVLSSRPEANRQRCLRLG
jgi:hypothetical protein